MIPHGSVSGYAHWGCREECCSVPHREYRRLLRQRGAPDYVDEIAVERACRGDRSIPLNRAEMAAAFAYLDAHGYSHRRIADVLGVTDRTVCRWRANAANPRGRGVA